MDISCKRVSHETIYEFVFRVERDLVRYFQCGRKRRRKHTRAKRSMIPHRTGIEARPEYVNTRQQPGHWETAGRASVHVASSGKQSVLPCGRCCSSRGTCADPSQRSPAACIQTLAQDPLSELRSSCPFEPRTTVRGHVTRQNQHLLRPLFASKTSRCTSLYPAFPVARPSAGVAGVHREYLRGRYRT